MDVMWKTDIAAIASVVGLLMVAVTLLPIIRSRQWWIRIWDFPRLQILVVCAGVITIWLLVWSPQSLWQTPVVVLVIVAMIYQVVRIFPYSALASQQAMTAAGDLIPEETVTVLVSNVRMKNRQSRRLLQIIEERDPDVVLALETDEWWLKRLEPVTKTRPHVVTKPLGNTYGMLLFSRFPLSQTVVRELTREQVPSIRTTITLPGGRDILFYGLHPPPPFPGLAERSTPRDAELVLVAREVAEQSRPTIVAGDLNDVAWSDTTRMFQRISGLLDPRIGRGMYNTFHAQTCLARWPLDHVFFSEDFALVELRRLPAIGSDHFPLTITLTMTRDADHEEPQPADRSIERMADEVLEEVGSEADVRVEGLG